jgi:hypothetical protein
MKCTENKNEHVSINTGIPYYKCITKPHFVSVCQQGDFEQIILAAHGNNASKWGHQYRAKVQEGIRNDFKKKPDYAKKDKFLSPTTEHFV